jgi:hypothetical protein
LHQAEAQRLHHDPEPPDQEAAQHRAPVVARPAHDHHHPDQEGEAQRLVGAGHKLAVERGHHRTGDAADGRAEDEDLQVARLTSLPMASAAVSLSRMARIMRPQGEFSAFSDSQISRSARR